MNVCYTLTQVARELGISVYTVKAWIKAGKVMAIRTLGGHRRITEEELERIRKMLRIKKHS